MKTKVICEVGLNHMGSEILAKKYLNTLVKSGTDGISFQIKSKLFYNQFNNFKKNKDMSFYKNFREKSFYKSVLKKKNISGLELSNNFYKYARDVCKKNKKMFGIALGDIDKIAFFSRIKVDFIKILSEDFFNISLINKILKSNIPLVCLSTGSISKKNITILIKKIKKSSLKKVCLIYTKFSKKNTAADLKNIEKYKKIHPMVAYGNHSHNQFSVLSSLRYSPNYIFFYIKSNQSAVSHPDEKHAVSLRDSKKIINKIISNKINA